MIALPAHLYDPPAPGENASASAIHVRVAEAFAEEDRRRSAELARLCRQECPCGAFIHDARFERGARLCAECERKR